MDSFRICHIYDIYGNEWGLFMVIDNELNEKWLSFETIYEITLGLRMKNILNLKIKRYYYLYS